MILRWQLLLRESQQMALNYATLRETAFCMLETEPCRIKSAVQKHLGGILPQNNLHWAHTLLAPGDSQLQDR